MNDSNSQPKRAMKFWGILAVILVAASGFTQWRWLAGDHHYVIHGWLFFCLGLLVIIMATAAWRIVAGVYRKKSLRWFFSMEAFRTAGWSVLMLLSVLAMFYSVESWFGRRALVTVHREAAADGESLGLQSLQLAAVPDEQNFARTAVLAPLFDLETNRFDEVTPRNTPALQQLVEMINVQTRLLPRNAVDPQLPQHGGWMNVQFVAWTKTPAEREEIIGQLSKFRNELEEIRKAAERPSCVLPVELSFWPLRGTNSTELLRGLARLLEARSLTELNLGDNDAALEDVAASLRVMQHANRQPRPMQLFAVAPLTLKVLQPVWEGLAKRAWSSEQVAKLQQQLASTDILAQYPLAARTEIYGMVDFIETLHVRAKERWREKLAENAGQRHVLAFLKAVYPRGWLYQDEAALYSFGRNRVVPGIDLAARTLKSRPSYRKQLLESSSDPFFFVFIAPKMVEIGTAGPEMMAHAQTGIDLATIACALERYRAAENHYPDTLDSLVPRFASKLPHDVIDGKPLRYRLLPDGNFVLYSIGSDRVDNGGVAPRIPEHSWYVPSDNDWVWSYSPSVRPKAEAKQ